MPRLTLYQYNEMLKTGSITLLCGSGPNQEAVQAGKGFVVYYSLFFAGLIAKSNFQDTIELGSVPITAVKTFARWCYEGRLDPLNFDILNPKQAQGTKFELIDLWLFSDIHQIHKLQNQTMGQLRTLFCKDPSLCTKEDVEYVFKNTPPSNENSLRNLMVAVVAVKIDMGKEKIENYERVVGEFPAFFSTFARYQKAWLLAYGKVRAREKAGKMVEWLEGEEMTGRLRTVAGEVPEWVLLLSGAKMKPQGPGEVIELD